MRYRVTNARPEAVTVAVVQAGLSRGLDTRVTSESQKGEQRSLDTRVWQVAVPANGQTDLTIVYETSF
jgi:hypothetical protein